MSQLESSQDDNILEDNIILDLNKYKEERLDPYNNERYKKNEFHEYYGGYTEWEFQDPEKVLIRQKIIEFSEQFSDLNAKKFIFLFKQYEKTF